MFFFEIHIKLVNSFVPISRALSTHTQDLTPVCGAGSFVCHQCGQSGGWPQLEDHLSMLRDRRGRRAAVKLAPAAPPALPPAAARAWEAAVPAEAADAETLLTALENLGLKVFVDSRTLE